MNIEELIQDEGKPIFEFKRGDIIIRMKSVIFYAKVYNQNLGVTVEVPEREDWSFRRTPGQLEGIKNGNIYMRSLGLLDTVFPLPLELYKDNWAMFEIPDGLTLNDCI